MVGSGVGDGRGEFALCLLVPPKRKVQHSGDEDLALDGRA